MIFLILLCAPLFAGKVALIHNFTPHPETEELFAIPTFQKLKEILEKNNHSLLCVSPEKLDETIFDKIIIWNITYQKIPKQFPKEKLILFTWEPAVIEPRNFSSKKHMRFSKIYTWNDDLIDNRKFFKFYYPVLQPALSSLIPFEERKLCTFVFSNKSSSHPNELYTERENIIRYFENQCDGDFEFYGMGWDKKNYKNYRGTTPNKLQTLNQYRFAICYENTSNTKGYVTEKIFDCFAAGSIPIYLGASNIETLIPKECFIDRRQFKGDAELHIFLKSMTKDQYETYLQHIKIFLKSGEAKNFSLENFANAMLEALK